MDAKDQTDALPPDSINITLNQVCQRLRENHWRLCSSHMWNSVSSAWWVGKLPQTAHKWHFMLFTNILHTYGFKNLDVLYDTKLL